MGFVKTCVRYTVITGLAVGAAVVIAGPRRTAALLDQFRAGVNDSLDECIDDPTALRSQLRQLEEEYPERIAQVRGDSSELQVQIQQLERDHGVAQRVVQMADVDITRLQPLVQEAQVAMLGPAGARPVAVAWNDALLPIQEAEKQLAQVRQTRMAYSTRADEAERDLVYLRQQGSRLEELLDRLQSEHTQFQAQVWQLDRQVDSISRNERLIEIMEERQASMDAASRYEAGTLDGVQQKLAAVRSRQEAQLEALAVDGRRQDYEEAARAELLAQNAAEAAARAELPSSETMFVIGETPRPAGGVSSAIPVVQQR